MATRIRAHINVPFQADELLAPGIRGPVVYKINVPDSFAQVMQAPLPKHVGFVLKNSTHTQGGG